MKEVVYTDTKGFSWLVRVNDSTQPKDYRSGIRVGPPDLSGLHLPEEQIKVLQNRLVEASLVNAELIRGSVSKLHNLVKNTLPTAPTKEVVRAIKAIYQKEFFEE
jgi:hypothetical protein